MTAWENRIVGEADVEPAELKGNPLNWREHPDEQFDAVEQALDEIGWTQRIVVNKRTNTIVDGHLRHALAERRGEPTVPVLWVDLTARQEKLALASLDTTAMMAVANGEKLGALLQSVRLKDGALRDMIGSLVPARKLSLSDSVDEAPELPGEGDTYVERGDVWALGPHRLICADATIGNSWDRLLDGELADLLWTDPPYGVDYAGGMKPRAEIDGDDTTPVAEAVLRRAAGVLRPGSGVYVFRADRAATPIELALLDAGIKISTLIVWNKSSATMSRTDYRWQHEALFYGWLTGARHRWYGGHSQTTVWDIPRPPRSDLHPTMKPVELVTRALENSTRPGELVVDPFVGSGTAIIGAEEAGRVCRAMEVDAGYAQVSIERWQTLTGQQATKIAGN